ncbi:hypothetical protein [Bailinhaonella thermotolerans]|uniref:Uncharacterized protein n=1 Tax=Bailinhaonella thermotolerans TaxID=1070861 RepID=A0A3A4AQ02_9ACTN|nr:hypothetical protein [Bailinhaonella thermotolerans]RJL31766.1 hypothetical protein D5H75_18915 [Bailinhaonella thermotolerans]
MAQNHAPNPAMPGQVRAVQVLMWIGVAFGVIALVLTLPLLLSPGSAFQAAGVEPPPMGALWGLTILSAIFLVAELILVLRIPRRQASTRTGIIVFFGLSAVVALVNAALSKSFAGGVFSVVVAAVIIGLLMSAPAKEYFSA